MNVAKSTIILRLAPLLGLREEDFLGHFRNTSIARHLHEAAEFADEITPTEEVEQ